jgi:hypothetical protein
MKHYAEAESHPPRSYHFSPTFLITTYDNRSEFHIFSEWKQQEIQNPQSIGYRRNLERASRMLLSNFQEASAKLINYTESQVPAMPLPQDQM